MTDVRLVATNPDDGLLVPVASNASGQLAVQSPKIEKIPNNIEVDGEATFAGQVTAGETTYVSGTSGANLGPDGYVSVVHSNRGAANCFSIYDSLEDKYTFSIKGDGSAVVEGRLNVDEISSTAKNGLTLLGNYNDNGGFIRLTNSDGNGLGEAIRITNGISDISAAVASIKYDGTATFCGDVVIGSRGKEWLIRESNGVAMLIEQSRRDIVKVRDLPRELDLIEAALNEVMEKLRMTPPAGWEVWDGSDNSR